jgi:hypothetical protein
LDGGNAMNVRKTSATTLSMIILTIIFALLLAILQDALPYSVLHSLETRFLSLSDIGAYHSSVLKISIWLIIIVGIIDAVLRNTVALSVLSSFKITLVLAILAIILIFIPVSTSFFWGLMYVIVIIGIYLSFHKLYSNNNHKSRNHMPFLKGVLLYLGSGDGNIWNRYTVVIGSVVLAVFFFLLIISLAFYLLDNWRAFL